MDQLYIVMPAYNEEETIRSVVEEWYPCLALAGKGSRLVVDISGSLDHTEAILKEMQEKYPALIYLKDGLKQHGPKLIRLYKYAVARGADFVFQTDSDGQTNPDEFPSFWHAREQYDIQIGHRKQRGDGAARKAVEMVLCGIVFTYFGVRVPDTNAPFRLMRCSILKKYLKRFRPDYNLPNVMLSVFFTYYKEKVAFREISFLPRRGGKNSINMKRITKIGINALADFMRFRAHM